MALRRCAAGMVEAGKQFRRVNGHLHLPALRAALEREITEVDVVPVGHTDQVSAPYDAGAGMRRSYRLRSCRRAHADCRASMNTDPASKPVR